MWGMWGQAVPVRGGGIFLLRRGLATKVFGWGSNDAGELGSSLIQEDHPTPKVLEDVANIDAVCCGYGTTHFHTSSLQQIHSFGLNSVGQLGLKNDANSHISKLNCSMKAMASGRAHMLVLTANEFFAAGSNILGQCGIERDVKFLDGYQKPTLPFRTEHVKQICCGLDNSLILTNDGRVFTTGLGADGQTGVGSYDCRYGFEQVAGDINAHNIIQISATTDACLALSDNGFIFGWGNNEQGQISRKIENKQIAIPVMIPGSKASSNITQVFAGGSYSAILDNGSVYVKGYGALGLGHNQVEVDEYTEVGLEKSLGKVIKLCGNADYLAALTDTGSLLTWGRGTHGRLGQGSTDDCFSPKKVDLPGRVFAFSCGVDHMVALVRTEETLP